MGDDDCKEYFDTTQTNIFRSNTVVLSTYLVDKSLYPVSAKLDNMINMFLIDVQERASRSTIVEVQYMAMKSSFPYPWFHALVNQVIEPIRGELTLNQRMLGEVRPLRYFGASIHGISVLRVPLV